MISGALYQRDTIVFDFLLCMKDAFFAKPKSATLMFPVRSYTITNELTIPVYKYVIRLDISMQDHLPVHDVQGCKELLHHCLDFHEWHWTFAILLEEPAEG